ncbi:MAG: pyridoxal-phosphate dependent enzyme, partial [Acidobacteria bacterium]|nr:pyridoxal-phosphate dependent enzyme [Acidobacteriota bacterium]
MLSRFPSLALVPSPTIIEPLPRLSVLLGGGPRLLIKRDDAIPFGFGGNKVRKLAFVGARAQADGADTLITAGGVQSNHARVTAAVAAKLGMRAVLVANGEPPERPAANVLLNGLLGAEIVHVGSRDERAPK